MGSFPEISIAANILYLFSLSFPSLSFSRPQNPPFVLVLLVVEVVQPK